VVELDPTLALGEEDRLLDDFPELRDRNAFPLGEVDGGHAFLAIDAAGGTHLVVDEVYATWASFHVAFFEASEPPVSRATGHAV
jgi:acyl-coenzyme A thioesterase PaaI-like protein